MITDPNTKTSSDRSPGNYLTDTGDEQASEAADDRVCRVVFVEDNYLTALDTVDALDGAGYDVVAVVQTGEDAVRAVEEEHPDLVVMDIRLNGGLDGVDAALEIFRKFGIRSIFATAHTDELTRQRAAAARPLAWLAKPYNDAQLLNVLASARARID